MSKIIWNTDRYGNACAYQQVKVPGVTTVINEMIPNPEIDKWIEEVGQETADRITNAANQRGTAMHAYLEHWLNEMKEVPDPGSALRKIQAKTKALLEQEGIPSQKIQEGINLFYNFYESEYATSYTEILGTETAIYSPKLFYRGKIDWLYTQALYGLSVSDFKSSSKVIEKGSRKEIGYKYQVGAYALALEHMLEAKGQHRKVNYSSIISMHTKSSTVQNISLCGDELDEYKAKFETIAREYHIKIGQENLLN